MLPVYSPSGYLRLIAQERGLALIQQEICLALLVGAVVYFVVEAADFKPGLEIKQAGTEIIVLASCVNAKIALPLVISRIAGRRTGITAFLRSSVVRRFEARREESSGKTRPVDSAS